MGAGPAAFLAGLEHHGSRGNQVGSGIFVYDRFQCGVHCFHAVVNVDCSHSFGDVGVEFPVSTVSQPLGALGRGL